MSRFELIASGAAVVIICLLLVMWWYVARDHGSSDSVPTIQTILMSDSVQFQDFSGNEVQVVVDETKATVVYPWATWSPTAQSDLSLLNDIAQTHADTLQIVAINRSDINSQIERFLANAETSHLQMVVDGSDQTYHIVSGATMPELLLYNREGVLVAHVQQRFTKDYLLGILTEQGIVDLQ
jgi:hypothetical protein